MTDKKYRDLAILMFATGTFFGMYLLHLLMKYEVI